MENQLAVVDTVNYLQNVIAPLEQIEEAVEKKNKLENQLEQKSQDYNTKFPIIKSIGSALGTEIGTIITFIISALPLYIVLVVLSLIIDIDDEVFAILAVVLPCISSFAIFTVVAEKFEKKVEKILLFVVHILVWPGLIIYIEFRSGKIIIPIIWLISYILIPIIVSIGINKYRTNVNINKNIILTKEREQLNQQIAALNVKSNQIYSQNADLIESVPHDYCNSYSLKNILNIIQNCRADNLKEAINVFEQDEHNRRMENMMSENNEKIRKFSQQVYNEMDKIRADVNDARKAAERAANRPVPVNNYYYWY